jgi:hypothetical protein
MRFVQSIQKAALILLPSLFCIALLLQMNVWPAMAQQSQESEKSEPSTEEKQADSIFETGISVNNRHEQNG